VELFVPQRGERLARVELARKNAADEAERATSREERQSRLMELLGQMLGLEETPHRFEAYDISNTGAADIVASMTVHVDGKPVKKDYRRFHIKDLTNPDDYASMEQVLRRRFRRYLDGDEKFSALPDLLLMDGGAGQVGVAVQVLRELGIHVPVFGMVKDDRHRTRALVAEDGSEIGIQSNQSIFALIGRIQEETHRFAITFHRQSHAKSTVVSSLEEIPGVGEVRRKALLKHFRSLKAIREAEYEQLCQAVPKSTAKAVWEHFHSGKSE
jgi:excinuclease ABC subunit C